MILLDWSSSKMVMNGISCSFLLNTNRNDNEQKFL
jgi:hypothetical protein